MKTTCSKCSKDLEVNRIGKKRYCLSCSNTYMRNTRPKHSQLTDIQRKKANARAYLNTYVKRGKVIKGVCIKCGACEVEGHHEDYTKPLEVIWLCKLHHMEITLSF